MREHNRKPSRIVSVHVDIVEFLWETECVLREGPDSVVLWLDNLRKCLAKRDPSVSEYGAKLLAEVEEYRELERERKRKFKKGNSENPEAQEFRGIPRKDAEIQVIPRKDAEMQEKESNGPVSPPPADPLMDPNSIESRFEMARKQFPGRKLGFATEFQNFIKRVGGRAKAATEVDRLLIGIEAEKADREKKKAAKAFIPEWKNFRTWINARAWEQEFAEVGAYSPPKADRQAEREAKLRSGFALAAKLKEAGISSAQLLPLEVK